MQQSHRQSNRQTCFSRRAAEPQSLVEGFIVFKDQRRYGDRRTPGAGSGVFRTRWALTTRTVVTVIAV